MPSKGLRGRCSSTRFATADAPDWLRQWTLGLSPSTGGAPAGVISRRTLGRKAQAPRVPTKAQQAVDKLLDKIRTNADQTPSAAKKETERGEAKRDANGRFAKRTRPGPGRPPGSRNKISKAFKEVLRDRGEGI